MRPKEAIAIAQEWIRGQTAEERMQRFAERFEHIVSEEGCGKTRITSRMELAHFWDQTLNRRNGVLSLYCVVFDLDARRVAIVYAPRRTVLPPEEADILELDAGGRVVRSKVLRGRRLIATGVDVDLVSERIAG